VKWFIKKTIRLDNGVEPLHGDDVGVLLAWKPPGLMDGVSINEIGLALDRIARGMTDDDGIPTGQLYGPTTVSKDNFVGKVLEDMLNSTEQKAKDMIKAWLASGVLEVITYDDPVSRKKDRKGVKVIDAKRPDRAI